MENMEKLLQKQIAYQRILIGLLAGLVAVILAGVIYIGSFMYEIKILMDDANVLIAETTDIVELLDVDEINTAVTKSNELMDSMNSAIVKADGLIDSMDDAAEKTNSMLETVSGFTESIEKVQDSVEAMNSVVDGMTGKVNSAGKVINKLLP